MAPRPGQGLGCCHGNTEKGLSWMDIGTAMYTLSGGGPRGTRPQDTCSLPGATKGSYRGCDCVILLLKA